MNRSP